jgi:hypothetical protein
MMRFVTINEVTYLRKEDIVELLLEFGGSEETDVRNRMDELIQDLQKVGLGSSIPTSAIQD